MTNTRKIAIAVWLPLLIPAAIFGLAVYVLTRPILLLFTLWFVAKGGDEAWEWKFWRDQMRIDGRRWLFWNWGR